MDDKKIKLFSAIAFQFVILFTLVAGIFLVPELREIFSGAIVGLAVGIAIESIKQ
jgi:hypothetical protein